MSNQRSTAEKAGTRLPIAREDDVFQGLLDPGARIGEGHIHDRSADVVGVRHRRIERRVRNSDIAHIGERQMVDRDGDGLLLIGDPHIEQYLVTITEHMPDSSRAAHLRVREIPDPGRQGAAPQFHFQSASPPQPGVVHRQFGEHRQNHRVLGVRRSGDVVDENREV